MSLETIIIQTGVGLNNINVRKGYDISLFKLFKLNNCIDMFYFLRSVWILRIKFI